jgi:hypothetical protein
MKIKQNKNNKIIGFGDSSFLCFEKDFFIHTPAKIYPEKKGSITKLFMVLQCVQNPSMVSYDTTKPKRVRCLKN